MKHRVAGVKLGRSTNQRQRLFHNLIGSFIEHDRITTTLPKAKAMQSMVEKLVTQAKRNLSSKELLVNYARPIRQHFQQTITRFIQIPGGYTRLINLGTRMSDGAKIAMLEWSKPSLALIPDKEKSLKSRAPECKTR
ncbi:50S ribosomal protein L17 [Candidatus Gottesmanbacteria bacterium]|nr:50S ribosomal protein L17 [Candidatus Gottesmanbacteria bacterium]